MTGDLVVGGAVFPTPGRRNRERSEQPRLHSVTVRLSAGELAAVSAAAALTGLTPSGYVADVAVTVAGGGDRSPSIDVGVTRAELAQVQQELFAARTGLVAAGRALNAASGNACAVEVGACTAAVGRVDALVSFVHEVLRRSTS